MDIKGQMNDLREDLERDVEKLEGRLTCKLNDIQQRFNEMDRIHKKLNDIGTHIFDALKLQNNHP
jgi:flagellar capping protein FliD